MMASRLDVPVMPVRLDGVDRVLHPKAKMATPRRVRVAFGAPVRLRGDEYAWNSLRKSNAASKLVKY